MEPLVVGLAMYVGEDVKVAAALGETIRLMKEPCLAEMFEKQENNRQDKPGG